MADKTPHQRLTEPFPDDELELLPRYTGKKGADGKPPRESYKKCDECGGYHPFPCIHLTYVGHAGITMRLNDVDPDWSWEPMGIAPDGTPAVTREGLWIRMTVLGKTLPAFGDAQGKTGANAVKEMIGDAIRNGAMRFGVGTYLWSKSEKAKAILTRGIEGADDEDSDEPTDTERFAVLYADAEKHGTKDAVAAALGDPKGRKAAEAAYCLMTDTQKLALGKVARGEIAAMEVGK